MKNKEHKGKENENTIMKFERKDNF